MKALDALLEQGLSETVYSHARAVVRFGGQVVYEGGNAPANARFDLASVTKVMSTTALLCRLAAAGRVDVQAPLRTVLPDAVVAASLADLAFHRSGLPAFVPYFAEVARKHPELFDDPPGGDRAAVRAGVVRRILATPAERPVGASAVYSDVGFLLLGEAIAKVAGRPLDQVFTEEVARPLGLEARFRRLSERPPGDDVISTGALRPRPPAPGQEGQWECPQWRGCDGEVDDDNAWVLDGVAGHAGLFATAADVGRFGQAVLDGWLVSPEGWARDRVTPASTRTFGFDTPSDDAPSCGPRFGRKGPRAAIGHLGFTGTSLWIDLDRALVVALLTNRVIFGRENVQIRQFRPRFHEAVLDALGV
ncbi:MAG: beta-lactamase family protein [Myxococcaceae bacterium]|nr:beta-lactamase family protein [Myxococcaceae bacterium]